MGIRAWIDYRLAKIVTLVVVLFFTMISMFGGVLRWHLQKSSSYRVDYNVDGVTVEAKDIWILSIGSTSKPKHQAAQNQTIGKHFRYFAETEDTVPECVLCEVGDGVEFLASKKFMSNFKKFKKGVTSPYKPRGWWCAQKRGLLALDNVLKQNENLPEFLFIIDDDTFVNVNALVHYAGPLDSNTAVFRGMVGCWPGQPKQLPYINGGGGALISRWILNQLKGAPLASCIAKMQGGEWCDWHSDWILAACIKEHTDVPPQHVPLRFNQWGGSRYCGCGAITCHDHLSDKALIETHTKCLESDDHINFVPDDEVCYGRASPSKVQEIFRNQMTLFCYILVSGVMLVFIPMISVLAICIRRYRRPLWDEILTIFA